MKISILFAFGLSVMCFFNCGKTSSGQEDKEGSSAMETQNYDSEARDNEPEMSDAPVVKLRVTNIEDGTKVLGNQAGNSYHAKNMFDDNPATGWAIKLSDVQEESDRIYGPSMNVNARKLDYILIQNGYGKNRDSFFEKHQSKAHPNLSCH